MFPDWFATFAWNIGPLPPIKSAGDLSVTNWRVKFVFPMFSKTSSPVVAFPLQLVFVPSLFNTAVWPGVTAPTPKSRSAVVKFISADVDIVTLTNPVLFAVTNPVNSVPMKNNDITITAIDV